MASPLRPYVWRALEVGAEKWTRDNPGRSATEIARSERQRSFPARAAFAVHTLAENIAGRDLGAAPCLRCGLWTHAYCEGCSNDNLGPICTSCDSQLLLCPVCEQAGLTWQGCRNARIERQGPQPVMEVNGIYDGEGRWCPFNPPVEIPIAEFEQQSQDIEGFVETWLRAHGFVGSDEPEAENGC